MDLELKKRNNEDMWHVCDMVLRLGATKTPPRPGDGIPVEIANLLEQYSEICQKRLPELEEACAILGGGTSLPFRKYVFLDDKDAEEPILFGHSTNIVEEKFIFNGSIFMKSPNRGIQLLFTPYCMAIPQPGPTRSDDFTLERARGSVARSVEYVLEKIGPKNW